MLATNLTLDEEDAVQAELKELQAVSSSLFFITIIVLIILAIPGPSPPANTHRAAITTYS
jgi:hypothetical protein